MQNTPVIFVISEDAATIEAVKRPFQPGSMSFREAGAVDFAADEAKSADPSLVILDEGLERADWLDVYRRLGEKFAGAFLPVLVLVEAGHAEAAVESMESGLADVLVKPVAAAAIKARLKAMLLIKEIHDELDRERIILRGELDDARRQQEELAVANEELKKLSNTDGLTGLANHRYLDDWLKTEFQIASRYGMPLSAMMIDLDNFKALNDEHGHLFGDQVLKGVARIIRAQSRRADVSARYGGEEFAVVLPNTDGYAASNLAHRIHQAIGRHTFKDGARKANITASLGISTYPADGVDSPEDLIELADRALYAAKARGRDGVVSWSEID